VELDYLTLFIKASEHWHSPVSVLAVCFLAIGRIAPIISISPFFGARVLPNPVKVVTALVFMAIILPKIILSIKEPPGFNVSLFFLMLKEVLLGYIFGFFLSLPFLIVSSAGVFIDHQRGAASLMTNDPTIQNQSSPLGTLYNYVLIATFWALNGPFYVIDTLYTSYDLIPPGAWLTPVLFSEHSLLYDKVVNALFVFSSLSLQLAMPAFLAILMTDTFLGIINRLAPQVQITFLGMGLKSWFALLMVCIGFVPFVGQLEKEIHSWLLDFQELVQECKYPDTPPQVSELKEE
jgi:type III secretion protein SpaR/YscT/HrcT